MEVKFATAWILILVAVFPLRVKSSGLFELDLVSFENLDGREISGGCCSGQQQRPDGSCPSNCSVSIHFCIFHYQVQVDEKSRCTFFELKTPVFHIDHSSVFTERSGMYNVTGVETLISNFSFGWPGEFSMVVTAWHSSERKDYARDLVTRFIVQRTLDVNYEWTIETLTVPHSNLRIRYRLICDQNYYGARCEKFCRSRNDSLGHYNCSDLGSITCLHGWTNESNYCLKPICDPPCIKGQCGEPNNCRCNTGWTGPTCSTCIKYPGCKHGQCTVGIQCLCDEGWGGMLCDQDLNYCTNHKPCKNGGTCTNTGQGLYTCSCSADFMGTNCEIHSDPCLNNPCENGGSCKNPSDGQYICECMSGYFGPYCETWANICQDSPCLNEGSCIHDPEGFKCSCPLGYSGDYCQDVDKTNCRVYRCFNGGTCVNSSNGFQCLCPHGVIGSRCEIAANCSSDTCQNDGSCVENNGNITCICRSGFSGTYCQLNDNLCSSNPCANGATCINLLDDYHCDCAPGYSGLHCHEDSCGSSPCQNGASCHATANGFSCQCLSGYKGHRCNLIEGGTVKDWNGVPSVASNVSHRISKEEEKETPENYILIASISIIIIIFILTSVCVMWCIWRRKLYHQQHVEQHQKTKECDFEVEEERLQNERNAMMHMNNKQCDNNMPQKIVNDLDRVPAKLTNEAPPKVLNKEVSNKTIPDKSLICSSPRTFQKIDNMSGTSFSCHSSQDCSPYKSGGIYVIEDHLRSCQDSGTGLKKGDILATEV